MSTRALVLAAQVAVRTGVLPWRASRPIYASQMVAA